MSAPNSGADRTINGRYTLLREIGRGGMATIWEARDSQLGRRVAVKLLHPQFASDPEFIERFAREARSAASLTHPNIVAVFDAGVDSATGAPFLVLELVDGPSLRDVVRQRERPFDEREIRLVGTSLAEALEYAHRRGIIHRDVKPANVLLGGDGRPRLTDFGIAQAATESQLTRTGSVMGSVHYLAPEVARGQPSTSAADVYALGVVLYELATGRTPFSGTNEMAVALAHVEQPPPPPRTVNPNLSPQLEGVILRALSKDPSRRFGSAGELAAALGGGAGAQETRPVAVLPPRPEPTDPGRTSRLPVQPPPRSGRAVAPPPAAVAPSRRAVQPPRGGGGPGGGVIAVLLVLAAALVALGVGFFGLASSNRDPGASGGAAASPTATSAPAAEKPTAQASPAPATRTPTAAATPTSAPSPSPTATVAASPTPRPATATPVPPATATPRPAATPTPNRPAVPNVTGRTLDDAFAALRAVGLVGNVRGVNVNAEKDTVVAQTPEAGGQAAPGSTVVLSVATGQVVVPDVIGRPEAEATRALTQAGLRVGRVSPVPDARVPVGAVVRSSPVADSVVARGSAVDLVVSAGAPR